MWILLTACGDREEPDPYVRLDPVAHAVRASMAIRGVRPTDQDLALVRRDPGALAGLVDAWVESPEFAETVQDMYAEWLLVRADVVDPLPALGIMEGRLMDEMSGSLAEAPLELVRHVVTQDLPLTELVTADYTLADDVVAAAYGLPYDAYGPEWQVTTWIDDRPGAGLLSDSELWRRHESAGSNFNRLRANLAADVFLCASFANRDIVVEGGITISDEFEVAEAVRTQAECVNCHQALDPLAAFFWGFKKQTKRTTVNKGYKADCSTEPTDDPFIPYAPVEYCYPLELYSTEDEDWWEYWDLRPPGYYGTPASDLDDLGDLVAADPRFAQCTARRFYGYMTQSEPLDVPLGFAQHLQQVLVGSGFSAKSLAKEIALSDSFAAEASDPTADVPPAGVQIVRPEQYARMIEALTGFAWRVNPDQPGCEVADLDGTDCWGQVDLMRSDRYGFRAMAGGIDGFAITAPIHSPTPPRELVWEAFAGEAAGYVVGQDLANPDRAGRRLLREIDADETGGPAVRRQVVALWPRVAGRFVADGAPEVDALVALWEGKHARTGDPAAAWTLVLTALFVDPDTVFF